MQSGWRVGNIFNIPLFINPSWFFILVFLTFLTGSRWQVTYPQWGALIAWGNGFAMSLLLFASVLLHELGHSLVARRQGIKVSSITLFLFGGIAALDQEAKTPGKAFQVAIAGPAVSLVLCGLLSILAFSPLEFDHPLKVLAQGLAEANLVLTLFNLIPGLPLDGGQVLKALVWKITGSRFKGIHWAARVGKALGWLAVILGATAVLLTGDLDGMWLALLGWFGVQNASAYDRMTDLQEALLEIKASDAMTREFRVVDAEMSLRRFADDYVLTFNSIPVYYAASHGRYRGLVVVDDLQNVERSLWESQNLFRIIHPLEDIPAVAESVSLSEVIRQMETDQLPRVTVLSPAGAVSGVIDRGDVVRALAQHMGLPVSEAMIKQIKEQGSYPPGFQLGEIAQSATE